MFDLVKSILKCSVQCILYVKPELEVPKKTRMTNKSVIKACPTHFDHCHDLFRGELSKNQVIFQNIHLRAEICGDLCGVFDKTDAQR